MLQQVTVFSHILPQSAQKRELNYQVRCRSRSEREHHTFKHLLEPEIHRDPAEEAAEGPRFIPNESYPERVLQSARVSFHELAGKTILKHSVKSTCSQTRE